MATVTFQRLKKYTGIQITCEQDVLGFEVSVDDAAVMQRLKPSGNLHHDPPNLWFLHVAVCTPSRADEGIEILGAQLCAGGKSRREGEWRPGVGGTARQPSQSNL